MRYLCVVAVVCCSYYVSADTLDPVIVLDTEASQVGDVEHTEYTGSYDHINDEDIERENSSIAELIAHETGVQYRQAGATGSYSSITLRGATAAQTNVFLDGVLLNDASNGGVDLSQLELLNLDGIDLYRGATPVQLGASTLGGAVNLRSKPSEKNLTRLLLGVGSFNEQKIQLSRQGRIGNWDSSTALSHTRANNDFKFTNENGTPLNTLDDRTERRINNEYSRSALLFKAGRQVTDQTGYDGSVQYTERDQALPHWRNEPVNETSFDTGSVQLQFNRRNSANEDEYWNHTEGVYVNRSTEGYDDRMNQVGLGAQTTLETTLVYGARTYWEAIFDNGTLALNLDLRREDLNHEDRMGNGNDYSAMRTGANVAMQYSLFRFNDRLLLTPALRLQSIADDYDGVVREGESSRTNTTVTPQIGTRWQHSESSYVTANIGQHYREPVFFELFGDRGLYIGNDELVAEEGINIDVGFQWNDIVKKDHSFGITGFASFRDELIVSVYDARGTGRSVNSGKARIIGVEGDMNWRWGEHWLARVNMTLQSAENLSSVSSIKGKQLPGEAQFAGYARLAYQRAAWNTWYEADVSNGRYYDTANLLPAEDQFIHNLGISYTRGHFKTRLVFKNIANDNAEDFNGFPKPGKSFHLTFTYSFDGEST